MTSTRSTTRQPVLTLSLRAMYIHLVPDLERTIDALCHVLRPGGKLITPTLVHDETALAWVASRVLANVLGQPMHRRFTTASLRTALEQRGLRIARAETIPGIIPIAYIESVLTIGSSPH